MAKLVAPDGVLFVINDTEPGQADAAALAKRRADLPPLKNVNQLLGGHTATVAWRTTGSRCTKSSGPRGMVSTFLSLAPLLMR